MMMDSTEAWTQFFGWYTVVSLGIYVVSAVAVMTMRDLLVRHGKRWFGVPEDIALRTTYQWIGAYKLAIVLFGLTPWIALKLIA